jgi:hypothetical protein
MLPNIQHLFVLLTLLIELFGHSLPHIEQNFHDPTHLKQNDMSIVVRKSNERGHNNLGKISVLNDIHIVKLGWLDTYHTFSFADYYDADFDQFGSLRVLNEDRVKPGRGFGTHSHREFEIFSYIIGNYVHCTFMNSLLDRW